MARNVSPWLHRAVRALALATTVLALAGTSAQAASTVTSEVTRTQFGATLLNACTGELVDVTGTVQERFHATFDPQGGTHTGTTITLSDVKAVGQDTGTTYLGTGVFLAQTNISQTGFETTGVNWPQFASTVNLISRGSADNLVVHLLFNQTLRLDGGTVVVVDQARSDCVG
jgi:hypothetical protein